MNTAELDDFFARAEDVLTDWRGGTDAMHARVPTDDAGDVLAPRGDSYYDQVSEPDVEQIREATRVIGQAASVWAKQMQEAMAAIGRAYATIPAALRPRPLQVSPQPLDDVRQRALELRRNRNTGPVSRLGLDGHFR